MLVQAAAQQWSVDAASCHVDKGVVIHGATGRRATYGSLANAAAQLTAPAEVPLKDAKEFTLDWQTDAAAGYAIENERERAIWAWTSACRECSRRWWRVRRCSAGKWRSSTRSETLKVPGVKSCGADSVRRGRDCRAILAGKNRTRQTGRANGIWDRMRDFHRANAARFCGAWQKPGNRGEKDRRSEAAL